MIENLFAQRMILRGGKGENAECFGFCSPRKYICTVKDERGKRGRERMYFQAEHCFPGCSAGYTQNAEEADRMEPWHHLHFQQGGRGLPARELSSKTNNSCSHASVVFLQLRSFSKEALNRMNLPGLNLDDSGLTAMSTNCHLESPSAC